VYTLTTDGGLFGSRITGYFGMDGPAGTGDLVEGGEKGFRFTSSKVFLTYAQADDLSRDRLLSALGDLGYYKIYAGEELHSDGGKHYHVIAFDSKKKVDIKNARYWDIDGRHPNVRHIKSFEKAYFYVSKDGNTFGTGTIDPIIQTGSVRGFRSIKADYEEFTRYVRTKSLRCPFPLILPYCKDGDISICKPDPKHRQRCLWIHGPANTGKSYYFTRLLDGASIYYAGDGELAFDTYSGEVLIVYDDKLPSLSTCIELLNTTKADRICPGRQRYYPRVLQRDQARFVIIISNQLVPWCGGCQNSTDCQCPGCTRTIYFNWIKHYDVPSFIDDQKRSDFS